MKHALIPQWTTVPCPVVAMLHLAALPGAPAFAGDRRAVLDAVLRDAEALVSAGVHGMMLENFGDVPFLPQRVDATTVAHMTAIACEIRQRFQIPLGINVLRNDGLSALAIADAAGAQLLRVNVLCGVRVTDQGLIQGIAHDLLRQRTVSHAPGIKILADVHVKHSTALSPRPLEQEASEMVERGLADALIVTGEATGVATDVDQLRQVKQVVEDVPVLVGSGVTLESIPQIVPMADGLIVGTALKEEGVVTKPVDPQRAAEFMDRVHSCT